jgi:hypothetical protein
MPLVGVGGTPGLVALSPPSKWCNSELVLAPMSILALVWCQCVANKGSLLGWLLSRRLFQEGGLLAAGAFSAMSF